MIETYQDTPILVRVQKRDETINQSAQLLSKAMKIKSSKKSILIQMYDNTLFGESVDFEGIVLLKSPSFLIKGSLDDGTINFYNI